MIPRDEPASTIPRGDGELKVFAWASQGQTATLAAARQLEQAPERGANGHNSHQRQLEQAPIHADLTCEPPEGGPTGPGGGLASVSLSLPSLYILGRALRTPVADSGTSIGNHLGSRLFVWGSEETCANPYNEALKNGRL